MNAPTIEPVPPRHRDWRALIPILAGLFWLTAASGWWLLWAAIPGLLLAGSGVALLLWPGDARITSYMGLGGVVGLVLALPAAIAGGFLNAVVAALLSAAGLIIAGRVSIGGMGRVAGAPLPDTGLRIDAKAAADEALLGYLVVSAELPQGDGLETMCNESLKLMPVLDQMGALDDPSVLHPAPTAPAEAEVRIDSIKVFGQHCERLRYPSGFVADARLPGAALWASHRRNQNMHALMLRHTDGARPWLVCVHGYRMGMPWVDLQLFAPTWLHQSLGLNLLIPTLPLHGPRRVGRLSGDQYLDGNLLDLLHAQSQALWDLRRAIAWIRAQDPTARIGVWGYSLGGFNTALLATYEENLDFVIAGIPVVDLARALWRVLPPTFAEYLSSRGVDLAYYRKLVSVVSPLSREPLLPVSRRGIFAGAVDRVVEPYHPVQLSAHWGVPVQWYQGGHLTFRGEPVVGRALSDAMAAAGWSDTQPTATRDAPPPETASEYQGPG